jgi:hypothetical protein
MLFPEVWKDTFDLTGARSSWSTGFVGAREAYIISCYVGISCLMIALLGLLFSERRRLKWILLAVSFAAIALALGKYTPVYSFLFQHLPPFRLGRYPAKYLLATALCFSLLAGLGVDQLDQLGRRLRDSAGKRRLVLYSIMVGSLLIASALLAGDWLWRMAGFRVVGHVIKLTYQGHPVDLSQSLLRHSILYLCLVLVAGLLLVLFSATRNRERGSWIAISVIGLIFFDLLTNHSVNPLVHSDAYDPSPVAEWLVSHTPTEQICRVYHFPEREYRILGTTDSFIWNFLFYRSAAAPYTAASQHIQYSSFMPVDRLETLTSQMIDGQLKQTKDIGQKLDYLATLNTGYVLSMNPVHTPTAEWQVSFDLNSDRLLHIYRLKNATPRAYLADLQVLDPVAPAQGSLPSNHRVEVRRYSTSEVDLSATAGKRSMLVLLDSYYPGWRVWVDGREQKIEEVNRAFRGVMVEPGQHQVRFRYDPKSFRYGLALTLSTLAAWVAALMFLYGRRYLGSRRRPTAVSETEQVIS